MNKQFVKIYTDEEDTLLVIDGENCCDVEKNSNSGGIEYYPIINDSNRFGTVVCGKNGISITEKAKDVLKYMYDKCPHTWDDISSFDIFKLTNGTICISYIGPLCVKYNIKEITDNPDSDVFWWGEGEGKINISLLDELCN